jgi:hypothetical protein
MILEEINGDVRVVLNGRTLAVGDSIEDSQYSLVAVLGVGKAMFRVSPNTTTELKGTKEPVIENTPPPPPPTPKVEAAPVVERVPPAMETPSETTEEE